MNQYEVTFIVDPVLSGDEIKATAQVYVDRLQKEGCKIVHVDEIGLKQLAYPINKRTTGVYFCVEFTVESGNLIDSLELSLKRDDRIMRFLTVKLDKYGVKYNEDKRNGLIGKKRPARGAEVSPAEGGGRARSEEDALEEKIRANAAALAAATARMTPKVVEEEE